MFLISRFLANKAKEDKKLEKVFCFNCAYYWFDSSRQDGSFRCKEPHHATYKKCTADNPINPGGVFELKLSKDAWKVNKNNDCKYHKEA